MVEIVVFGVFSQYNIRDRAILRSVKTVVLGWFWGSFEGFWGQK